MTVAVFHNITKFAKDGEENNLKKLKGLRVVDWAAQLGEENFTETNLNESQRVLHLGLLPK